MVMVLFVEPEIPKGAMTFISGIRPMAVLQSTLNNSYRCPAGQNNSTFLAGNYSFSVSEIEVFAFDK